MEPVSTSRCHGQLRFKQALPLLLAAADAPLAVPSLRSASLKSELFLSIAAHHFALCVLIAVTAPSTTLALQPMLHLSIPSLHTVQLWRLSLHPSLPLLLISLPPMRLLRCRRCDRRCSLYRFLQFLMLASVPASITSPVLLLPRHCNGEKI